MDALTQANKITNELDWLYIIRPTAFIFIAGLMLCGFFLWALALKQAFLFYLFGWLVLGFATIMRIGYRYFKLTRGRKSDEDGVALNTRLFGNEYLVAIVEGIAHGGESSNLPLAYNLASKIMRADFRKAQAMLLVAKVAARNGQVEKFQDAVRVARTRTVLAHKRLKEKDKADLLISLSAAVQEARISESCPVREEIVELVKFADGFKNRALKAKSLAVLAGALMCCNYVELAESLLDKVLVLVQDDGILQAQIVEALMRAEDYRTLMRIYRKNLRVWPAAQILGSAARLLVSKHDEALFQALLPSLRVELRSEDYIPILKEATEAYIKWGEPRTARELMEELLALLPDEKAVGILVDIAQLGRQLNMEAEVLSRLRVYLDALNTKKSDYSNDDASFISSMAEPLAAIAESLASLELAQSKQLALETIQRLFLLTSEEEYNQGTRWATLWNTIPALAKLGGRRTLLELWRWIRPTDN